MPINPLSPLELTGSEIAGVESRLPFFTTRSWPFCWPTSMRPSGKKAIQAGPLKPEVTSTRWKLAGSVWACACRKGKKRYRHSNSSACPAWKVKVFMREDLKVNKLSGQRYVIPGLRINMIVIYVRSDVCCKVFH